MRKGGFKSRYFASASILAGLCLAPSPVVAQDASEDEIVVVGTRRTDITVTETTVPVDVISAEELQEQGLTDLNDILRAEVPSFNVQRLVSNDGAVFTRPFSLRGLPPDQTLVLVNGKRRHRGATVQFTNVPQIRGSQGPDLAAIPTIAVERLEVLRDGASANYGSDAIAGVLNFQLRDDDHGATLITRYGQFYAGDGADWLVQGNIGLPLGQTGFLNVSGEWSQSEETSRGVQRPDAQALINAGVPGVPVPAQRWGNPEVEAARVFFNAAAPINDIAELYAFGNYSWSEGLTSFFYRNPTSNAVFASVPLTSTPGGPRFSFRDIFPGGFTPQFGQTTEDASLVGGIRGAFASELSYDVSLNYGQNRAEYLITNTVNPSLGPASPTSFRPGALEQRELTFNFDLSYPWEVGLATPLNVAAGLEFHRETYEVFLGDFASRQVGPFASFVDPDTGLPGGLPVGSNGFPGFNEIAAGEFQRDNVALYTALEGDITDRFRAGAAARFEDFSDFGSTFNWKLTGRYEFIDGFAARASVSTGFRAPSPGQSNSFNISTNIDSATGAPLVAGIVPPANPVAQALGARPLEPEESFNISAGFVITSFDRLTITLDFFKIDVDDRIALSGNFNLTQAQRDALALAGVPGANTFQQLAFFTNSFDSSTEGVDLVASYRLDLPVGSAVLTSSVNYTTTEVTRAAPVIAADRERLLELEGFTPQWKGSLGIDYDVGRFGFTTQANYYGEWTDYGTTSAGDQTGGSEWLVDLEFSYDVTDAVTLAIGGENVFDEYPDPEARASQTANGIRYMRFAPTGFNGGFWYVRAAARY